MTAPVEERFWAKVRKTESCWVWTAARGGGGYGHIKISGRMVKAHRVSYEMKYGQIPDDLVIDHLCRDRACVNPAHLEAVSFHENAIRGEGHAAVRARKTHCVRGHMFTPDNTYQWRTSRICRACARRRHLESRKVA